MNASSSRLPATGLTSSAIARTLSPVMTTTTDVFAKVRGHERVELFDCRARRPGSSPTSAGSSRPPPPVVEMEGAERIMLGSNNYLGLTGDERVIAGRP